MIRAGWLRWTFASVLTLGCSGPDHVAAPDAPPEASHAPDASHAPPRDALIAAHATTPVSTQTASTPPTPAPDAGPGSSPLDDAVAAVTADLLPFVRPLARGIDVYSYHSREGLGLPGTGPLDGTSPALADFVPRQAALFLEPQRARAGDATGLYLANDPTVSRGFGTGHWVLFRVRLAAGLSYVDIPGLSGDDHRPIPDDVQRKLLATGCDETKWRKLLMKRDNLACRDVARASLERTGAAALAYDWVAAKFVGCEARPATTFVAIRPGAIEPGAVQLFYSEMPDGPATDGEKRGIEAIFRAYEGSVDPNNRPAFPDDPWPDLSTTPADGLGWMHAHLLGCEAGETR